MLYDGGSLIVCSTALDTSLNVSSAPSLVVCDPSWLPQYPQYCANKANNEEEASHFLKITLCTHGVWCSLLGPDWLVVLNFKALESEDRDHEGLVQAEAINRLPWKTDPSRKVKVDHGNLFVFSEAAFPSQDPKTWYDNWMQRAFELTARAPLNITGDVEGPAGCFWHLEEDEGCQIVVDVLMEDVTAECHGIRLRYV